MSRWRCRRTPAIRSASGAPRAAKRELREPARAALERVGLGHRANTRARQHEPRRAPAARARDGARHAAEHASARRADGGHGPGRIRAHGRDILRELKRELTILLIEHDMEAVFALADRITVLVYGRVIASGAPGRNPRQCRGAPGLSRRAGGGASWLSALLDVDNIETRYGLSQVLFGISLADRAGRDGDADGAQRHGQDHDRALDHGPDAGDGRLDPLRRPRDRAPAVLSRRAARHRPGAGGPADFPESDRRARTWSRPPRTAASAADPWTLDKVCALFPAARRAARPAWATCCPAASSRCWRSAAR